MPVGVVPHYRPCLLVRVTSWVQREERWLQVWCYSTRSAINSDMSADPVPLSDIPACTVQVYQTYRLGSFIQIHVYSPSGKKSGMLQIHQTCLQVRCRSHGFVKLLSYKSGRHLEYIKFWVSHQLYHWNVTRMMSVTQESVKSALCIQFPGVCQSQGNFSYVFVINCHFGGHLVCIFILFYIFVRN